MDNQENNQINNTQTSAPIGTDQGANQVPGNRPIGVPAASMPPADPPAGNLGKTSEKKSDGSPPAKKDNKLMFLIIGAVLLVVLTLILIVFSKTLNKSNKPVVPTPQAQQIITPTPSDQEGMASQTPITNQQDVVNTLGELDKANPDTVGTDLGQNDQDASSFSQ